MADMKPPKRGGTPRRIRATGPAGGPYTPGARKGRPMPSQRERQSTAASQMRARRGLTPMLQQQGADKETLDAAELIESVPGGPELLYSFAVEQAMQKMGAPKKDTQKVKLYQIGGYVEKAEGGLASAAQKTRKGGRGDDSMIVHMTPEEFGIIETMWGKADTNPDTGMPEYGFFSKVWKKVKKAVKKVFSSKIFQIVAPIALSVFAPGLGTALGGALGLGSGATASIVGNALVRGTMSSLGGGDFATGAIKGAVAGGLGDVAGGAIKNIAGDAISESTANIAGAALAGGAGSELTGGDFVEGAITGGLGQYLKPTMENIAGKGQSMLGRRALTPEEIEAGGIMAPKLSSEELANVAAGREYNVGLPGLDERLAPGEMGPPAPLAGQPGGPEIVGPPAPVVTPTPATTPGTTPPAGTESGGMFGDMGNLVVPGLLAAGALGGGEYEEGQPPELPPHMLEDLPIYQSGRQFIGPTDPSAYYTYGQAGAPQTGESLFITPDPFAGETGTPTAAPGPAGGLGGSGVGGIQGMIAAGQPIPQSMVRGNGQQIQAAGYTLDPNTQTWMPPMPLGQGMPGQAMGGYQRGGEFDYWAQNADVGNVSPTVSAAGRYVKGPGTGRSDDIPARLSDGEYVIDAESVALLGDGSGDAGAKRLDEMRNNLRQHKAQKLKKGGFSHKAKQPHQYMRGGGMARLRAAAGRA